MTQASGGEVLVQALTAHDVDALFGLPGLHTLAIYDALYEHPKIRTFVVRHEGSAAFMADGYARASGRPGVCLTIPGPGVANTLAALGEAFGDSSPVLLIGGQIDTTKMGQGKRAFHEFHNQSAMIEGVVGWRRLVKSPEEIPGAVAEAFQAMTRSRQPVVLEIPMDVAGARAEMLNLDMVPSSVSCPSIPNELVERAASLLRQAGSPFILAGQGVLHASATDTLVQLAELMNAPVVTTELGRSAFPEDHPLSVGYHWSHAMPFRSLLEQCDLLLAIGTDLGEKVGLGTLIPLAPSLMHLDVRKEVVGRHFPVVLGLVGDAGEVLPRIVRELRDHRPTPKSDKRALLKMARASVARTLEKRGPFEYALVRTLRHTLPRNAIISVDAAAVNNWLFHAYTVCEPRTFLSPSSAGTLGFALPAALGAKVAYPERVAVAVVGDGGFLFTAQELATARKYGLNVIVLLFNDAEFGTIRYFQERDYRGRVIDTALCNPDFMDFSKSFGCEAVRVQDAESLRDALLQAMEASRPTVIEIPIAVRYPAWVEKRAYDV